MSEVAALNDDFKDILSLLAEAAAEFIVVGAHALAVHGVARATGDLDVLIRPSAPNADAVWRALEQFGAPIRAHGLSRADLTRTGTVYQVGLPPRRIDVLTAIDGVSFDEAWRGRVHHVVEGMRVPYLGLRELRQNKEAAGRPKDLADLASLDEIAAGR